MLPNEQNNISPAEITAVLRKRKRQILATFLLISAGVTAGTLLMPKQYESQMKILVKNERAPMVVTGNGSTGPEYRAEVDETEINTEIELLNNNDLLRQVVNKTGLALTGKSGAAPVGDKLSIATERAVTRLQKDLKIWPVRKADIIEVDYSSPNPRMAAAVLRALSESYLDAHLKVHGTPGTYEFFSAQAERYRNDLSEAESKLADLRRSDDIVMLAPQKEATLQKVSESQAALLGAEAQIAEYRTRIADIRSQLSAATPRVVTQSRTLSNQYSVEHLSSMLAELRNRRTQLLAKFQPGDRMVKEVDEEISNTQAALDSAARLNGTEQSTDVNPVHQSLELDLAKQQAELAGVQNKRQTLAAQARGYHDQLTRLGNATAAYEDLERTQKEAEENYALYSRKSEEARIAESLDKQKIANVAIAETPSEPHVPSKPNVGLNLVLGFLLAGFVSIGTAFGAEFLGRAGKVSQPVGIPHGLPGAPGAALLHGAVQSAADLEEITSIPVLLILDGATGARTT